jgi:hypothetical protein
MNLGELQAAIAKAFTEGASKTDEVYLNVDYRGVEISRTAHEVEQHIHDRKRRVVVIKGY